MVSICNQVTMFLLYFLLFSFLQGVWPFPQEHDKRFYIFEFENGTSVKISLNDAPPPATLAEAKEVIEFYYYRNAQGDGKRIRPGSMENLNDYLPDAPLYILCHGFTSNHKDFSGGFLSAFGAVNGRDGDFNLISVNWAELAKSPWYFTAAQNVGPVGTQTGCLLRYLIDQQLTSLDLVHFIGHSLGAQVGSHVGNMMKEKCSDGPRRMARITALDPAYPMFHDVDDIKRIDESDADFVDVIHTDKGFFGMPQSRGHVDFYPNGGNHQPGCREPTPPAEPSLVDLIRFAVEDIKNSIMGHICSHSRATEYFTESIKDPSAFPACQCNDYKELLSNKCPCSTIAFMGFHSINATVKGSYYLQTNDESPFGLASGQRKAGALHQHDRKREKLGILSV